MPHPRTSIPMPCQRSDPRDPAGGCVSTALPAAAEIAPRQVWTTLTPVLQDQTRHSLLRILQEVAHDAR